MIFGCALLALGVTACVTGHWVWGATAILFGAIFADAGMKLGGP